MEVLNTREIATLIWFAVLLLFGIWKLRLGPLLVSTAKSFGRPMVLRAIGVMVLYVALSVWLLAHLGLWRVGNLKTTLIWFVTFVLGWLFDLKRWDADPNAAAGATLREALKVTAIVTFLAEFYTFPLAVELVLVPAAVVLTLMMPISGRSPNTAIIGKISNGLLMFLGLVLLTNAAYRLASNFGDFATVETGREFAIPGLLALLFLPFMYVFNVYVAYDAVARVMPIRLVKAGGADYAFRTALLSFGLNVKLLRRWRAALFNLNVESREEVRTAVDTIKAAYRRERRPPAVPPEAGWSPYAAARWLDAHGLNAGLYNPRYREWRASSSYRKLGDNIRGESLAYYVAGTECTATQLTLTLNLDHRREGPVPEASIQAFADAVTPLITAAFGQKAPQALQGLKNKTRRTQQGLVTASLREDETTLSLTITHRSHVDPTY